MQATIQYIKEELAELYPENEVKGIKRLIFESVLGWSYTDLILKKNDHISSSDFQKIEDIIQRLKTNEPIQYILGETEFYGLKIRVTPSVLIPRPETEELVQWIIEKTSIDSPRILDIGTGSGCIPLALKRGLKNAVVDAVDISENALDVARQNALSNGININFFQADILKWENYKWDMFDVIVSNPPYVRELEKQNMQANVLKYEPENALFVSNENPLIFYDRIAEFAQKYLCERGKLFFEINEYLGGEMCTLLEKKGFVSVKVKKDIKDKNRLVTCQKKK